MKKTQFIKYIFKKYSLNLTERLKYFFIRNIYGIRTNTKHFFIDPNLYELMKEINITLKDNQLLINKQLLVINLELGGFNAFIKPLSKRYDVIFLDYYTTSICTTFSSFLEKYIPEWLKNDLFSEDDDNLIHDKHLYENDYEMNSILHIKDIINKENHLEFENIFFSFLNNKTIFTSIQSNVSKITKILRDAMLLFVLCHECGHLINNSKKYSGKTIYEINHNWNDELEADIIAYKLMYETLSRMYKNVTDKALFNFGFELIHKIGQLHDVLKRIFNQGGTEFNKTHPDAFSRIKELRDIVRENAYNEEQESIVPSYIIMFNDFLFDIFERKLFLKLINQALLIDNKYLNKITYKKELMKCFSYDEISDNISGIIEWEKGNLTNAIYEFLEQKINYSDNFKHIISILYMHEYEKLEFRMKQSIGQLENFQNGVDYLENNDLDKAIESFKKAQEEENDKTLSNFALGYTYSKRGKIFLDKKQYEKAINDFREDIRNNPVACRDSFYFRNIAITLNNMEDQKQAQKDMMYYELISHAPTLKERINNWLENNE